jgi:2-phospho-L-lactate transferase/gluconeogenesis factor (CofD/UPF0052 family)
LYVCNVATQHGETDGFDLGQHMSSLQRHVGRGLFTHVLANDNLSPSQDQPQVHMVSLRHPPDSGYQVISANVVDPAAPWRHDPGQLSAQIIKWYHSHRRG